MSSSYILDWERLRAQLRDILRTKGKTVSDEAPMATLVPLVNSVGINNVINNFINNVDFDLIDDEGIITTVNSTRLSGASVKLKRLVLPALQSCSSQAFQNSTVTSATIATENPDTCIIGASAFSPCTSMTEFIGGNIRSNSNDFIGGCTALEKIVFNSFYTENYAFRNNPNLKIVDFGYSPIIKNASHFNNSPAIKAIVIRNTEGVITLDGTNPFVWLLNNVTGWYIYVPDELVEDYKVALQWSTFADYFAPLSEYDEEAILNGGGE